MWRARAYLNLGMRVCTPLTETQTHGGRGPAAEPPKQKNSKLKTLAETAIAISFHFATHTALVKVNYIRRVYATTVMHAERTDR
jgi:hypothetical protein